MQNNKKKRKENKLIAKIRSKNYGFITFVIVWSTAEDFRAFNDLHVWQSENAVVVI